MGETERWFESINQNAWQDLSSFFFFLIMKVINQLLTYRFPPFPFDSANGDQGMETKWSTILRENFKWREVYSIQSMIIN